MPQNLSMALKHRMNYLIERQGVVSGNIANSTTPNYLSKDISFSKILKTNTIKMQTSAANHIQGKPAMSMHKMSESLENVRHDGNSVKVDEEMLKLQDIQMHYRLVTELYKKHAGFQQLALRGTQ